MSEKHIDELSGVSTTGHEWDGLKELNTPLPRWWLWTLYATVIFSAVWVLLYPAFPGTGWKGLTGWTARGELPALKVGARIRIRADDLSSYLETPNPCPSNSVVKFITTTSPSPVTAIAARPISVSKPPQRNMKIANENARPWATLIARK